MRNPKSLLVVLILLATASIAFAQDDRPTFQDYLKSKQQGFNQYQHQKESDFDAFRKQANAQFAAKMAEAWQLFDIELPVEAPDEPDPVTPMVRNKEPLIPTAPIKLGGTITPIPSTPETLKPRPKPTLPESPNTDKNCFSFSFYNTSCKVRLDNSLKFKLSSIDEKSVAAVWQQLSGEASNALVADCFQLIDKMNLCDWAAICLFKAIGDAWLGKDSNESVLMQMYLMTQTGFKARIGRMGGNLVILAPFDGDVYGMSYYNRNGEAYYIISGENNEKGCLIYQEAFPNEKRASLKPSMPLLSERHTGTKAFKSEKYPAMTVQVELNRNVMDFMEGYPQCRHDIYVYMGLSESTKQAIYPVLREAMEGKPLNVAANMLLNFMHTAFDYQTDIQQFGRERPFFGDESFWFPYNDCEDRAILYCIMIHDLLGIDVALLSYPGHMSTAIALPMEVKGNHIVVDGKRYLLCDPTYIGSHIGEIPEKYQNLNPKVIIIK